MTAMSPIESEFATQEEAEAHDRWFRAKVMTAMGSDTPSIAHDMVMAEMRRVIDMGRDAANHLAP